MRTRLFTPQDATRPRFANNRPHSWIVETEPPFGRMNGGVTVAAIDSQSSRCRWCGSRASTMEARMFMDARGCPGRTSN